jgi:ubiquinone/menaquinone biosynthesis C-methylase UbiE
METENIKELNIRGGRILDIGCGEGKLSLFLSKNFEEYFGIDSDPESIKSAKTKYPNQNFSVTDANKLPFSNDYFDYSIFSKSLHHLDPKEALQEAARVTKVGGKIIIIELVPDTEYQKILKPVHDEKSNLLFTKKVIMTSGLKILSTRKVASKKVFSDLNDLITTMDARFGKIKETVIENTTKILGNKIHNKPLILEAELEIYEIEVK